jgi:hypothetical protein
MRAVPRVQALVGEEINGVAFFMDYLELHFNGPVLRALYEATLETPTERWRFPDPGSREAMCQLITATVADIHVDDERSIQLRTDKGQLFTIPFGGAHEAGIDAAEFIAGLSQPVAVW